MTCEDFRIVAPELALGALDGAEREAALAHVTVCAECRSYIADLSRTADALLLVGPEAEPPADFETTVAGRLQHLRSRDPKRWQPFAAAAAIIVVAMSLGLLAGRASAPAQSLRRADIVGASGARVGAVFLHQDDRTSWCYVELETPSYAGVYDVRATMRDGRVVVVEQFSVTGGSGSYGRRLQVPADDIIRMTIESTDGRWSYWADLST